MNTEGSVEGGGKFGGRFDGGSLARERGTGWLLTWLSTTPQQLTDESIQPVGVNIEETWE